MRELRKVEYQTTLDGVYFVSANAVSFPQPLKLVHADYAIKLTTAGVGAPLTYRGAVWAPCTTGTITVFAPFETIAAAVSNEVTSFITLLIDPSLVADRQLRTPHLPHTQAPHLMRELNAMIGDLGAGEPQAAIAERFTSIVDWLFAARGSDVVPSAERSMRRVRDLILERLHDNVSLEEFEHTIGMSRFHIVKLFHRQFGMPPHAFRTHARIAAAKKLITKGVPLSAVAAEVGFCDQSQMHRHFCQLTGLSPGRYRQNMASRRPA